MSEQSLLDALHAVQLWGIVGESYDPSIGKIRCGSNDEYLEAYRTLECEVRCLVSEHRELNAEDAKLWEQCNRLFDKTLEMADEYTRLKESLAESERDGSMAWDRTRKVEAENEELRKLVDALDQTPAATVGRDVCLGSFHRSSDLSSGMVPIYYCRVINKSIFVMRDATYCPLCGGRIEAER